jgi:hypothetical protein
MASIAKRMVNTLLSGLVEQRVFVSIVFSVAIGKILVSRYPLPTGNTLLLFIAQEHPRVYATFAWTYLLFLFTTPFLMLSAVLSLAYIHLYQPAISPNMGKLPPYPEVQEREQLFVVVGETHQQVKPTPAQYPTWLSIPENGLYTGIAIFGSLGSGKTQAAILPFMRQLFGYRATDDERKLSGLVLEVKGDLCRKLRNILRDCQREGDYVEVSLDADWRYNPLHNDLDPYALAFNIASLLTNIWGRGKEPFWQQSYTDLVKYIIILHQVKNDYVTLFDIYATAISPTQFEALLLETGARFLDASWVVMAKQDFKSCPVDLSRFDFRLDPDLNAFRAKLTPELERILIEETDFEATVYKARPVDPLKRELFEAVDRWYWEHWKHLRPDIKTSVVQGIAVFLSLFDTDPQVKRIFCPPKAMYEGRPCPSDPKGVIMPPFADLIEQGKICGLNFPVALNPGLAKAIGTMMKQDYQRAVLLRIPKMDSSEDQYFRPTVFLCDEYQTFATVGSNDPNGDERFLSLSREPKCIPIVTSQSINSLKDAIPGQGYKTLLQSFRTKIFLATSDPETARYASELCGKIEKTKVHYSIAESSNDAHVGLLSGKASSNKSSITTSKAYQRQREPLFDEKVFYRLKNAQSILTAYDGINPLPPTYCFLKPDFLPKTMNWFEQEAISFDPKQISQ